MSGTELGVAYLSLSVSSGTLARDVRREMGTVEHEAARSGERVGKGLSGSITKAFAGVGALFAADKVKDFFTDAIGGASDLNEASTKTQAIFGSATAQVNKFASQGAKALGQTQLQVLDTAATFGTFGKAAGKTGPDLAKFSTGLAGLSTDLASFFNVDPAQAAEDIAAGLRGEAEPLRKYGILMDDASLKAQALKQGLIKTTKDALTPQSKVLAAQALIYAQTKDAQGDFQKTSGGLANQQRILAAQFSDLKTGIGKAFLPVVVKVVTFLTSNMMPVFDKLKASVGDLYKKFVASGGLEKAKALFEQVKIAAALVGDYFKTTLLPAAQVVFGYIKDGAAQVATYFQTTLWPILQTVFGYIKDAAAAAGTYFTTTLVPAVKSLAAFLVDNADAVKAFAVGIGTMVVLWKAWTTAVKIWAAITKAAAAVQAAFNVIMSLNPIGVIILAIAGLVAGLTYFFTKTKTGQKIWGDFTAFLSSAWDKIKGAFSAGWKAIQTAMNAVWGIIKTVWKYSPYGLIIDNWSKIIGFFKALPGKILSALSSIGGFFKKVFSYTPLGIIIEHFGAIVDYIKSIPGRILAGLGNLKTLLGDAGRDVIDGFLSGIQSAFNKVKDLLGNLTDLLPDWKGPAKKDREILRPAGRLIIAGLVAGITDNVDKVKDSLTKLTEDIGKVAADGVKKAADKMVAARKAANAKITASNKAAAKQRDKSLTAADKISDSKARAAAKKAAQATYKAKKQDLLPTLSQADAEKAAKKNQKTVAAAVKKANATIAAQGKYSSRFKALGASAGTNSLLAGLTKYGNVRAGGVGATARTATLTDVAKAREVTAARLSAANDKLTSLIDASNAMRDSVKSTITGELDLTKGIGEDSTDQFGYTVKGKTTFASVAGQVKSLAAKAKAFAGKLQSLIRKGVAPGLVQEVASLGTENGSKVADALLSGSSSQVRSLNADYSSLNTYATNAGTYVADQMYGVGIDAQKGLIAGLQADDAKLEAAAKKLTDKLTKAVKKNLGIKSPSRVMADEVGAYIPAGVAMGIDKGQATLDRRMGSLVNPDLAKVNGSAAPGGRSLSDDDIAALASAMARVQMFAEVRDDRTAASIVQRGAQAARRLA